MSRRHWLDRASLALALAALALAGMTIGVIWRRRPPPPRPRLMTAFLDVGPGDCTLVRSPDGHAVLIDAGPAASGALIARTLQQQGIRSLDLLVLATPTPGSIGGVPALLDGGISVAQVWDNTVADTSEARRDALLALRARHTPVRTAQRGDKFLFQGARLAVLWPPGEGDRARRDALVCRLDYGRTGIVLAGVAGGEEENFLVANAASSLSCDVLEIAAGGADSATSAELLRRATPSVAVISCAITLPPGQATLHRLEAAGAAVWRTDTQGAITLSTDGHDQPLLTATRL